MLLLTACVSLATEVGASRTFDSDGSVNLTRGATVDMPSNSVTETCAPVFDTEPQKIKDHILVYSSHGKDPTSLWSFSSQTGIKSSSSRGSDKGIVREYSAGECSYKCLVPSGHSGFRCSLLLSTEVTALLLRFMILSPLLNNMHRICLPLAIQTDVWVNVVIDLEGLIQQYHPSLTFRGLERIELETACRIRKIFTLLVRPSESSFTKPERSSMSRERGKKGAWRASIEKASSSDKREQEEIAEELLFPATCQHTTLFICQHPEGTALGKDGREMAKASSCSSEDSIGRSGMFDEFDTPVIDEDRIEEKGYDDGKKPEDDRKEQELNDPDINEKNVARLHRDNVKLFASKLRADAKLQSLMSEYDELKKDQIPHREVNDYKVRRMNEQIALLHVEMSNLKSRVESEHTRSKQLELELERERAINIDQRLEIREIQAILLQERRKMKLLTKDNQILNSLLKDGEESLRRHQETFKTNTAELTQNFFVGMQLWDVDIHTFKLSKEIMHASQSLAEENGELCQKIERQHKELECEQTMREYQHKEHAAQAREWAKELADLKAEIRKKDAQIAKLTAINIETESVRLKNQSYEKERALLLERECRKGLPE
ncbi:hypothetical protein GUITHDRAFT_139999 [Guillardia theta CCMP2712]|uniref:Uncharacterized protein n=1 Tax=Guillardia theta (strain CCMP2712) TaxID=905079 RepID=L1J742_GUITC|nr:hypothetical protein GUITHDRAFT_139999 [Guillardia theta CCMP2712]EKX44162.1 hypothetical protein GUITHDRAFT_139999 [Guillardia theta CCMP2712]|eukprot:XP_005831142.1 hypothetical protein GUITHDRAFT_139999 [Guillardia theta CCMP2712]